MPGRKYFIAPFKDDGVRLLLSALRRWSHRFALGFARAPLDLNESASENPATRTDGGLDAERCGSTSSTVKKGRGASWP